MRARAGQRYTGEVQRTGNQHRLRVLNEETSVVYVDTGDIQDLNQPFRWVRVAPTIISRRNNGKWSTGYIENLKKIPTHKP